MENTIYEESLVHYALRNENGYVIFINGHYSIGSDMTKIAFFKNSKEAEKLKQTIKEITSTDNLQIRKVKVIDIGE